MPEFLGRLDRIIPFAPLGAKELGAIAGKYLTQLQGRMEKIGIRLELSDDLTAHFSVQCKGKDGARHLRSLIQSELEGPLSEELLKCSKKPTQIDVKLQDNRIFFQI